MHTLRSPDGRLQLDFMIVDDGEGRDVYRACPAWRVQCRDRPVLLVSRLGLALDGQPSLLTHFEVVGSRQRCADTTWQPVCGERRQVVRPRGRLVRTVRVRLGARHTLRNQL